MADLKHSFQPEESPPVPRDTVVRHAPQRTPPVDKAADKDPERRGYNKLIQVLRAVGFVVSFMTLITIIGITQLIGAPLYFVNREMYYDFMGMTKRHCAITLMLMTQLWGPTTIRVSGDESVAGQIRPCDDGLVRFDFPERLVMIANHQIYTDWLYLWWVGYSNSPPTHGNIYIILKQSLQYIPILGTGMMFFGFIFMSRKMATDRPRLAYRLNKLKTRKTDPRGRSYLDPMWLLLFPEGTNLSGSGREKSASWAKKKGIRDPQHMMLPRSTGSFFCLNELKGSVEYVYDCTVAYEGIPRGKFGEETYGLSTMYFEGRPPKSVNLYWRRFKLDDIPLDDQDKFDVWLREAWYKKDELVEQYLTTGRFPRMAGSKVDFVETEVRVRHVWEVLEIFSIVGTAALVWYNMSKILAVVAAWYSF